MEKGSNSVGGRPTYDGKGAKFSRGGVAGKSEQRQDSNVSLSPQLRTESSYFAISKLIRVLDSFKIPKPTLWGAIRLCLDSSPFFLLGGGRERGEIRIPL